jgi:RnfABCDGE-type electron transport complex B subunit
MSLLSIVSIGLASVTLLVMALVMTYILGWANVAFHVDVDPRIDAINDALPGANCGGCGFVGCGEYAEAIVNDGVTVNQCAPGGANCASSIADIMGIKIEASAPNFAIVHCGGTLEDRLGRNLYLGEKKCVTANIVAGVQGCVYGCLGFGDCEVSCTYDAIHIKNGLAVVDYEKCVGCGACAKACPRSIISISSFKAQQMLATNCSNKDAGKEVKSVCNVGCIGCKACSRLCDLFVIENNLASVNYQEYDPDNMDDLIKGMDKCPTKCIGFVGKNGFIG